MRKMRMTESNSAVVVAVAVPVAMVVSVRFAGGVVVTRTVVRRLLFMLDGYADWGSRTSN